MCSKTVTWKQVYQGFSLEIDCYTKKLFEPLIIGRVSLPDELILESTLIPGADGFTGAKYLKLLQGWFAYVAHPTDDVIDLKAFPEFHQMAFKKADGTECNNGIVCEFSSEAIDDAIPDLSTEESRSLVSEKIFGLLRQCVDRHQQLAPVVFPSSAVSLTRSTEPQSEKA